MVYPYSGTVTQDTGYSWKATHTNLSVTMVTRTSDQGKGTQVNRPGLLLYVSFVFLVLSLVVFYTTLNFFRDYLKVITICDEYIRFWNNGVYLSNQVYGNTRVQLGLTLVVY